MTKNKNYATTRMLLRSIKFKKEISKFNYALQIKNCNQFSYCPLE